MRERMDFAGTPKKLSGEDFLNCASSIQSHLSHLTLMAATFWACQRKNSLRIVR